MLRGRLETDSRKSLLATESSNLESHLYPSQLAVAVKSGAECMPHLARQWMQQHEEDTDRILLDFDESNAHNTVDRHTFLQRAHEIIPGVCRWLEFIYPTDTATFVYYRGRRIESRAGGQQGCPLIAVGHALVQRILLESLRVVEIDGRTTQIAPMIPCRPALDLSPGFADDGFLAGPSEAVRESLKHIQTFMPSLGLSFSRLEVVAAAGSRCTVDLQAFSRMGCTVAAAANISVMKSPIGSTEFCEGEVSKRVDKTVRILEAISGLPDRHIAVYLLRYQVGRMDYTIRTTPADVCGAALGKFDASLRRAFETIVGKSCASMPWEQACLPTRCGGLGLRPARSYADSAYYASRAATWARCEAIYPSYADLMDDPVRLAEDRLNAKLREENRVPPLPADEGGPSRDSCENKLPHLTEQGSSPALLQWPDVGLPPLLQKRLTCTSWVGSSPTR